MASVEVELIYRRNRNTGKIHRLLKLDGHIYQGEQCNLDQAHNVVDEAELRESNANELCGHCLGTK